MTVMASLAVAIRIYVRTQIVRSVGVDDYIMLLALALSITGFCVVIPEIRYGAGRHFAYLEPAKASIGLKLNFITQPIYLWAISVVKISIACFLLRIAPSESYRRFLWGSIIFLVVYTTACFLTIMLQCRPMNILWDGPTVKAVCFTPTVLRTMSYVNVSINIITDFIFAALPIPFLWQVQINRRTKIAVTGIMSLGVFACAAAIVKASYLGNYGKTGDFLWDSTPLIIWTVVECNTGIIAASIPTMKPLFKFPIDKTLYSSSQQKKRNYYMRQESGHSL
ncbi:hypothetical protein MMC16_002521 [Acarospora aff. strigata]|nr:hypothetical protein [Acarospora aff. strigata]